MANFFNDVGTEEIIILKENWETLPTSTNLFSRIITGFESTSILLQEITSDMPKEFDFVVSFFSRDDEFNLLTFFHDMKGKWGRFFTPFPFHVFTVIDNIDIGQDFVRVEKNNFDKCFLGYERLLIQDENFDYICFKINSVQNLEINDYLQINLNGSFDRNIIADNIKLCSFMVLCTLDNDEPTFNYKTIDCGDVTLNFIEVTKEYDEVI